MNLRLLIPLFLVLCSVSPSTEIFGQEAEGGVGFRVIVHADNPIASLEPREISKMLLRKVTRWRHGEPILAVDQAPDSPVRLAFSKMIHGKTARTVHHYWKSNSLCWSHGPPTLLSSDEEVLTYVGRHQGAIGYVSADAEFGSGVKALSVASTDGL